MESKVDVAVIARKAKAASRQLAVLEATVKNTLILDMAAALESGAKYILDANRKDLNLAQKRKLAPALIDRLRLDEKRIDAMAASLRMIAALEDPVGQMISMKKRPNGLSIGKMRVPIGVIFIVYESRPNVTSDCIGLCLKSGNAVILRGGSEALNSNIAIFEIIERSCLNFNLPEGAVSLVRDTDHAIVDRMLLRKDEIDLVIPRGGEALIRRVTEESLIPVIKHYKGVCHVYVDEYADLNMAERIAFNAKVQRPGTCNAMETLLVHKDVAARFLPSMANKFKEAGVEMRGCALTRRILKGINAATEKDWETEYLDLIIAIRVVDSLDEAIAHITRYGSMHSDAIVTDNYQHATAFLQRVDAACVYVNASTRFTDGGEFGMGAEMGISTEKLHARGPMGLEELTTYKYVVYGNGQIRG